MAVEDGGQGHSRRRGHRDEASPARSPNLDERFIAEQMHGLIMASWWRISIELFLWSFSALRARRDDEGQRPREASKRSISPSSFRPCPKHGRIVPKGYQIQDRSDGILSSQARTSRPLLAERREQQAGLDMMVLGVQVKCFCLIAMPSPGIMHLDCRR